MKYFFLDPYLVSRIRSQKTKFVPDLHIDFAASRESKPSESHLKSPKTPKSGILIYELLNRYAHNGASPDSSFYLIDCVRIGKQAEKQPEQTAHSLKKRIPSTEWKCFTLPYDEAWSLFVLLW